MVVVVGVAVEELLPSVHCAQCPFYLMLQGGGNVEFDINQKDHNGNTLLTLAVGEARGKAVRALVSAGAKVDERKDGQTMLEVQVCRNDIMKVQALVEGGVPWLRHRLPKRNLSSKTAQSDYRSKICQSPFPPFSLLCCLLPSSLSLFSFLFLSFHLFSFFLLVFSFFFPCLNL